MADEFNNVTGALVPDEIDDSTATVGARQNAANYKKQAAQGAAESGSPVQSQAESDTMSMVLAAVAANAGLVKEKDKDPEKNFQVKLTKPSETAAAYVGSQLQTGGVSPSANYYDLASGGFLELTNQTLIDKVTQASKDPSKRDAVYRAAIARAAILIKSGKDTSVEEVLDGFIKNGVPGTGSGGTGGPFSTTSRSVSLTNEGTSRQLLNNALTGYLGRQATVEENSMFLKALNVQEKANPTTTVTQGNVSGRNTTQTQNTTGGFDRNDFTERFAKSQEGYAEYQTATTYLDAFIGALEDKSRVVG